MAKSLCMALFYSKKISIFYSQDNARTLKYFTPITLFSFFGYYCHMIKIFQCIVIYIYSYALSNNLHFFLAKSFSFCF